MVNYFKQVDKDGTVIAYGITPMTSVPGATMISEDEYKSIVAEIAAEDEARKEAAEKAAEEARKKAEEEAKKRQATIEDYAAKVKAGTIALSDVPEEYRAEVKQIVDPTPTNDQLKATQDTIQEAIDFLIINGTTEV